MPVKLFTGLPGAGKTACLVAELLALREKEPERPVYALGIDGLAEGIAEPLTMEQLYEWWKLPPGAIIAIDEAQEPGLMPLDRGQPAEWIKRISKVRHEGMDFLLTTQHPTMLSSYVRRLVDQHVHAVRKFNTKIVARYKWGRCIENCEKDSSHRSAVTEVGTLPAQVFDLYKSANAHNMRVRIPLRAWLLPVLAVVAVGALVGVGLTMKKIREHAGEVPASAAVSAPSAVARPVAPRDADGRVPDDLRVRDYAKWMQPRVAGLLYTAPAFDQLPVVAVPRVFCIAVEDGSTHCVSEQGTTVDVPVDVARRMARDGAYNPFLAPSDAQISRTVAGDSVAGPSSPDSARLGDASPGRPYAVAVAAPGAVSVR